MRPLLALLALPLTVGGALALQALGAGLSDALTSIGAGIGAALPWLAGFGGAAGVLAVYGAIRRQIAWDEWHREEARFRRQLAARGTRVRFLDRGQE